MTRIFRAAVLAAVMFIALPVFDALAQDSGYTVLTVCTSCHNTKRICKNLGEHDAAWWSTKVGLMISKGAKLDPQGKDTVVTYLSSRKAGDKPVCD